MKHERTSPMNALPDPAIYFRRSSRGDTWLSEQQACARTLRSLSPAARWEFIDAGFKMKERAADSWALELARTTRLEGKNLLLVLRMGLERGDATSIQYWIKAVLPGLGIRRVATELARQYETQPRAVMLALYWIRAKDPTIARLKERAKGDGNVKRLEGQP